MKEITWLDSAVDDLARLRKFLSDTNPRAVNKAAKLIGNSITKLRYFPLIGRAVENLESYYDLFVEFGASGYHIRYRVYFDKIYVVHVKRMKELRFLEEEREELDREIVDVIY